MWHATGTLYRAAGLLEQGLHNEALPELRKGLNAYRAMGAELALPFYFSTIAEASHRSGLPQEALDSVSEGLRFAEKNEDLFQEAELHRQRGELLLAAPSPNATEAEACFHKSIEIARRQQSRAWELRATVSLARLWLTQGKRDGARDALAAVYDAYTEGFTTPDLVAAEELLGQLADSR